MGLSLRKIGQTIGSVVSNVGKDIGNVGSLAAADITGNQQAQQNASQALHNSLAPAAGLVSNIEQVPQAISQLPQTVAPAFHQAIGLGRGLISADKYVANSLGVPQGITLANPFANQQAKNQAAKQLIKGAVNFPIQAGEQLGNTITRATIGQDQTPINIGPIHVNSAPSLQTQYQQVQKAHGTLPAIAQTAFTGASDVAPLFGVSELGGHTPVIPDESGAIGKDVNKTPSLPSGVPPENDLTPIVKPKQAGQGSVQKPNVSLISGREVNPQALADLPPSEQMRLYGQEKPSVFNGPSLKLKSQQPDTKIVLGAQTPKAAIGENTYIMGEHSMKFNNAINIGSKLNESDKAKLSDALNGRDVGRVDNPELFKQTVGNLKEAYDNSLAVNRLSGGKTAKFNKGNFSPLYLKADTARLDELGVPKDQQYDLGNGQSMYVQAGEDSPLTAGKFKGYRNIGRKYADYTDAGQQTNGILKPANANALEDARMYANGAHNTLQGQLLYKQLKKIAPGEVSQDLNQKFAKNGEPLVHAANGNLPFAVTKKLNRQLTGFKSNRIDSPLGEAAFKAVEYPSKALRKVAFLAAPIHYLNLGRSFLATTLPSLHGVTATRGIGDALTGSLHPKLYANLEKAANTVKPGQELSPREFAGKLGVVDRDTRPNLLGKGTSTAGTVEKYSPFALQMRNLNRFNNVLGWKLAERVQELGIEPGTSEATAIGTEINKVIDRINPKMEGLNPVGERLATSGSLAPHWIRANIGLVKDALKATFPHMDFEPLKSRGFGEGKTGFGLSNAGDIARTNVLGGRVLFGATAVLASALATGQMPTLQKAISEAGLKLSNPYPNVDTKSKTKAKYPGGPRYGQVINLPSDAIGLAVGLLTDPKHFAIARETPALSAATQAITNQDFFGNPLVNKNQPGWQKKLAIATAEKLIPFTGQNISNKNLTPGQKAGATLGFRTKTNPNDPNYIKIQNYFNSIDATKKGLGTNAARAVDEYTTPSKDPLTGNYNRPNANDARAKAALLLQNPTAIDALIKMNQKLGAQGQNIDPLWTESKDNITKYLQYSAMPPGSADKTNWYNNNQSWYSPLVDARNAFFNSLPPGDPNKPKLDLQYPEATDQVTALETQYNKITDGKQKAAFLNANPALIQQWDKQAQYNNAFRQELGYAPLKTYPEATPEIQKQLQAKNYKNPQVQAYLDKVAEYNVVKGGAQAQFQGTQLSQTALKGVQNLANYGIVQNPDGSLATVGSGLAQPGATSTGRHSGGKSKYYVRAHSSKPYIKKPYIGEAKKPRTSKLTKAGYKPKALGFVAKSTPKAPKVSLKSSKV